MENIIKVILIILLLGALYHFPYSYYEFLRFFSMGAFIYLAIVENRKQKNDLFIIYIFLALLFQPFKKIALGRPLWNIMDILISLFLIYTILKEQNLKKQ